MNLQTQCANPIRARAGGICRRASRSCNWNPFVGLGLAGWLLSAITSVAASVEQSWIRTYGPADLKAIFLDAQGNVSAVGSEDAGFVRIEYGGDGTQLKLDRYPALNETEFNGAITDQA